MPLFQILEGGEWVVLGEEEKNYQTFLDCDFRLIRRPKKFLLQVVPK